MDITDIVSQDYVEFSPDTQVSKLVGAFDDPGVKGVVVVRDGVFEGVITRKQLAGSHHQPDQKVGSLVWQVPRLAPDEDVRKVAQLMIDGDSQLLPVFEGENLIGVVTADDIIEAVQSFLDAATVREAYSRDLVSVTPETTFGDALNLFRDQSITHLPVVENDEPVGILSLYDVTNFTVRSVQRSSGGDAGGVDTFGGEISDSTGRTRRGGFGSREGELDRLLDLPVNNLMVSPVRTIEPDATLQAAAETMFEIGGSSLVVYRDDSPDGILTKTDILDALTWEAGGNRSVQLYGSSLLDDMSYDEVVAMVDNFDDKDGDMAVLDAKIHLHEHDETLRGRPLLLARIRLHTDRGLFIASGEGYGASHAIKEARDVLERRIRDAKTAGQSKKPPSEEYWEKRFGWMLE
ncbi:CBS domain-containing protein [Halanaeroarchaeum sulfurireducens]|uniref:Signal transduction protein n=1 Tax=Halanaeroarchaeum sulfurireducens TaxID=1604004 RepID=A0A0F7PG33_9EURY|nr:CBS domain-containing protein [Halanaeroarchaeum sulfurireducens]AKH98228.1 signal transduction protein [Halanaeroarchaeum sulfurireducens]ALG82622.1 signal transduction protein [Halanaeroarchaeum sulfurireducens]